MGENYEVGEIRLKFIKICVYFSHFGVILSIFYFHNSYKWLSVLFFMKICLVDLEIVERRTKKDGIRFCKRSNRKYCYTQY